MSSEQETPQVEAQAPEFEQAAAEGPARDGEGIGIDPLLDVTVTVAVELGRRKLPLADVAKLGPGAVVELHRSIAEPVDLVAQGVPIARGEVVVIDDRFAIRITEIIDPKRRSSGTAA